MQKQNSLNGQSALNTLLCYPHRKETRIAKIIWMIIEITLFFKHSLHIFFMSVKTAMFINFGPKLETFVKTFFLYCSIKLQVYYLATVWQHVAPSSHTFSVWPVLEECSHTGLHLLQVCPGVDCSAKINHQTLQLTKRLECISGEL